MVYSEESDGSLTKSDGDSEVRGFKNLITISMCPESL